MSLTYHCPSCWSEIGEAKSCPACGARVKDFAGDSYEQKLIRALNHSEPTVPTRAAMILGQLRSRAAVEPLIKIAASSLDPYIQEAAVVALERIGDLRALPLIVRLSRDGPARVRIAADRAAESLEKRRGASEG